MFEIFNNTDKEIKEIEKLEKYMHFVVQKLKLEKGIFNIIFVSNKEIHEINREYPEQISGCEEGIFVKYDG